MLKVFFPGGDPLIAPDSLVEIEQKHMIAKGNEKEIEIRFLSRVFSMVTFEQAGV